MVLLRCHVQRREAILGKKEPTVRPSNTVNAPVVFKLRLCSVIFYTDWMSSRFAPSWYTATFFRAFGEKAAFSWSPQGYSNTSATVSGSTHGHLRTCITEDKSSAQGAVCVCFHSNTRIQKSDPRTHNHIKPLILADKNHLKLDLKFNKVSWLWLKEKYEHDYNLLYITFYNITK